MMNISRREFLEGGVAFGGFAATSTLLAFADETNGRRLRIGILSDIHLMERYAAEKFERALLAFRKGRVNGVLICGDLADYGVVPQLEEVAAVWEKVFPDSKGLDGEHVERLFHYGDHDNGGYAHKGDNVLKRYGWTDAERNANTIFYHPKETWERVFGEPWSPVTHKKVRGYDFVLSHHMRERHNDALGLDEFFESFKPDPHKPFFFSKHRVLRNTVCGPGVWGQDNGKVGKLLSAYPNCCAFCGHSHQTAVREDSIWQGAFTAVQVPSLNYVTLEDGHSNKPNGYLAEQGMLLDVYDDRMALHRLDFASQKPLGASWTITLVGDARPFAHETRRRIAKCPEFPEGARLEANIEVSDAGNGKPHKTLSLSFPVVTGSAGGIRAYDYEVTVYAVCFGGDASKATRRYFSPQCHFAPSVDTGMMQVSFPLDEFKKWCALKSPTGGAIHVEVRPREIFGKTGRALEADVMVVAHGAKTMADDARMRKAEAQQHEFEAKG